MDRLDTWLALITLLAAGYWLVAKPLYVKFAPLLRSLDRRFPALESGNEKTETPAGNAETAQAGPHDWHDAATLIAYAEQRGWVPEGQLTAWKRSVAPTGRQMTALNERIRIVAPDVAPPPEPAPPIVARDAAGTRMVERL